MEDTLNPNSGGQPGTTPAPPPAADTEDRRYAGLQAYYSRALSERGYRNVTDIPPAQAVEDYRRDAEAFRLAQKELETLRVQVSELDKWRGEAAQAKTKLSKAQLVIEHDPALLHLLDSIPTHENPDEQKAAITSYKEALAKAGFTKGMPGPGGTMPPGSPPVTPPLDEKQAAKQYYALLREGKVAEADKLMDSIFAMATKK